jgi:hypothetical protein
LVIGRFGGQFLVLQHALDKLDDLRVLDFDCQRIFKLFKFAELGTPIVHKGSVAA